MTSPRARLRVRAALLFLGVFALLASARSADAYPFMVRHGYTQCANCHADPQGGGLLTMYGRAQGEILMRMRYGSPPVREPTRAAEPAFGLLPDTGDLLYGASVRWANVRRIPLTGESTGRFILMQADLLAQYRLSRVRANASVGYVSEGGNAAALTRSVDDKLVSRVHWIGVDIGKDDQLLLRAGRMNIPFGIRSIEHTMFTRSETRSDINTGQSYGISLDYHSGPLRAAFMAIAGNFAITNNDDLRSRGAAALVEYAPSPTLAIGASSIATRAALDLALLTPAWRHAHGVFLRYSPFRAAVVNAEWDFLHTSQPTPGTTFFGGVGMINVDLEPVQGLHLGPTLEVLARDFDGAKSYGAWTSAWWFFLPHADFRVDLIGQSIGTPRGQTHGVTTIAQVHFYL